MKKRFVVLVLAMVMLVLPALARAATPGGFYAGLHGGLNYKMDRDFTFFFDGPVLFTAPTDFNWGWAAGATLGYGFKTNGVVKPRVELELTWRRNGVNSIMMDVSPYPDVNLLDSIGSVNFTSVAMMGNLLLDFDLGGRVYPYVGFGLGAVSGWLTVDDPVFNDLYKTHDTVFAYQAKAGLGYMVNDNVSLFAEYTYIGSGKFVQDERELQGMSDHSIMLGARFYFGKSQPAPVVVPPAPVVPVEPQLINSYRVFFDHDKSVLDNEAKAVIALAVAEFNSTGSLRIDVTGHTDTTGSVAYNLALSERRAEAVTNALVNAGIPRSAISVFAAGQYDLLVPTADNVRERQNRNVYMYIYK